MLLSHILTPSCVKSKLQRGCFGAAPLVSPNTIPIPTRRCNGSPPSIVAGTEEIPSAVVINSAGQRTLKDPNSLLAFDPFGTWHPGHAAFADFRVGRESRRSLRGCCQVPNSVLDLLSGFYGFLGLHDAGMSYEQGTRAGIRCHAEVPSRNKFNEWQQIEPETGQPDLQSVAKQICRKNRTRMPRVDRHPVTCKENTWFDIPTSASRTFSAEEKTYESASMRFHGPCVTMEVLMWQLRGCILQYPITKSEVHSPGDEPPPHRSPNVVIETSL